MVAIVLPEAQCGELVCLDGSEGGQWYLYGVGSKLVPGQKEVVCPGRQKEGFVATNLLRS